MTDDIEIEDAHDEESKDKNKAQQFTAFSKQKLGKGLQALKGQFLASENGKNYKYWFRCGFIVSNFKSTPKTLQNCYIINFPVFHNL